MTLFQSTHPADPVLLAQSWIRTLAQSPKVGDPQFIVDRSTGAPESVVVSFDDFRLLQTYALKGLLADRRSSGNSPETVLQLLQKPLISAPLATVKSETHVVSPAPTSSRGTVMVSSWKKSVDKFPIVIGSDEGVCDVVLEGLPEIAAQIGNFSEDCLAVEVYLDDAKVDGKAVDKKFAVKISSGSSISLGNYELTYFS
jgi:hypothetical protein